MKKQYNPKPFTQDLAQDTFKEMSAGLDDKRTLCNVIKQAFRCVQEDSYNLRAAQELMLEALWMGKRMHAKLYTESQIEFNEELVDHSDDHEYVIDWDNLDGRNVANGNWD
tara:strand:- start:1888 stop:2220 length:333 start_codon:yes stop_codon:yes gene_type:complete